VLDEYADQCYLFAFARLIGNLEKEVGLSASPIFGQKVSWQQLRPSTIKTLRQIFENLFQKGLKIHRML